MGTKKNAVILMIFGIGLFAHYTKAQIQTSFSPVFKYNIKGFKFIGKFDNSYYAVKGLNNPWQSNSQDNDELNQNYHNSYPENKVWYKDTVNSVHLSKYKSDLNKKWQRKLSCTDPPIKIPACFNYQGIIWLYYVTVNSGKVHLKFQKFSLKGESITEAQTLMSKSIDNDRRGFPFFVQLNGEIQRFLVLYNKEFKIFNTRGKEIYQGKLPYQKLRKIRLDKSKWIFYIDKREKGLDIVKYFPRIDYANRLRIESGDKEILDASFTTDQIRDQIHLAGLSNGSGPDFFLQTFNKESFNLIKEFKGTIDERVIKDLMNNLKNPKKRFEIKKIHKLNGELVLIAEEALMQNEHSRLSFGNLLVQNIVEDEEKIKTALIKNTKYSGNDLTYKGYQLIHYKDQLMCLFNQFGKNEHKGLFQAKYPSGNFPDLDQILGSKEGGIIPCPRLIRKSGEDELILFGYENDEYRLIRLQLN